MLVRMKGHNVGFLRNASYFLGKNCQSHDYTLVANQLCLASLEEHWHIMFANFLKELLADRVTSLPYSLLYILEFYNAYKTCHFKCQCIHNHLNLISQLFVIFIICKLLDFFY